MRPNFDSLQLLRETLAAGQTIDATSQLPSLPSAPPPTLQTSAEHSRDLHVRFNDIVLLAKQSTMTWIRKDTAVASAVLTLLVLACLVGGWLMWRRCSCYRRYHSERDHRLQPKDWQTPAPSPSTILTDCGQDLVLTLPSNTHGAWEAEATLQPMQEENDAATSSWFHPPPASPAEHPDPVSLQVSLQWSDGGDRVMRQLAIASKFGATEATDFAPLLLVTSALQLQSPEGKPLGDIRILARGRSLLEVDGTSVLAMSADQDASAVQVAALPSGRLLATARKRAASMCAEASAEDPAPGADEQKLAVSQDVLLATGPSPDVDESLSKELVLHLRPNVDPGLMLACVLATMVFAPPRKFAHLTFAEAVAASEGS